MFAIADLISRWSGADRVSELAERVAGRSRLAVWQRVAQRIHSLGPTEARGYVRARAAGVVQQELDRLIEQEGAAVVRIRPTIQDAALGQLVRMIASQIGHRQIQTGGRRAA